MLKALKTFTASLFFLLPGVVSGQNVSVDEGAFRITVEGEIVGREEFSIRRVGTWE
jgi:hypothetical protein